MVAWGWGLEQGLIGNRHEETSWGDGNIKNLECGDGSKTLETY